jgi:hypothetical protein
LHFAYAGGVRVLTCAAVAWGNIPEKEHPMTKSELYKRLEVARQAGDKKTVKRLENILWKRYCKEQYAKHTAGS